MDPSAATSSSSSSTKPVSEGGDNGAGADSVVAAVVGQEANATGDDASSKGADKKETPAGAAAADIASANDKEVGEGRMHVGFVVLSLCLCCSEKGCVLTKDESEERRLRMRYNVVSLVMRLFICRSLL